MKIKIYLAVFLFCVSLSASAERVTASLLYKIQMGDHSAPTDVVLESDGSVGVYDAYAGSYTVYVDGAAGNTVSRDFLKGGNCLVRNGNYFLFCNSEHESLDMLSAGFGVYQSFRLPAELKGRYDPTDALVADGHIFSVDNDNHRIIKTDITTNRFEKSVGVYGGRKLEFWYPFALAVDSKGVLYVSEVLNTRVQKITKELKFYEIFGKWGIKPGEFYRPTGIAVHKGGTLLIADGYTGVVQYLDRDGRFEGVLKDEAGKRLEFGSVTHIRINGDKLAVVDAFNRSVFIYELGD
ncbi:NHL repeat containing protein [Denitrovibrio acetiphilus DSM 12809]|uniref:NHL repeat containing protein n=1 Tax=Denitrovibrio acetiphilus (strain DSM 12809 / NBRC 114555 / N2460) TaxID=522772 RepID=D4H5E8_DENA2|nr:NHL repeat-containing protein [Denitrovibrio acetiphilus]ADD67568.1 NHL repeat containing protein [Denitrovibrio acetiphilus DSM 12809]